MKRNKLKTNYSQDDNAEKIITNIIERNPLKAVTMLVYTLGNFLNRELKLTVQHQQPQTSLMFMGTHSAILTVSEVIFSEKSLIGYRKFLEKFMDEDSNDKHFSLIAEHIHAWRNILVHGWMSLRGHKMEYDYDMEKGYEIRKNVLYINPKIYLAQYLKAFEPNGKILKYIKDMNTEDLTSAHEIIKKKYIR